LLLTTIHEKDPKKYAFKCHRVGDTVYPVNCINFHPKFGTFATGGCDGTVVLWDGWNKKKLTSLPKFPTSIAALAFNHDGSKLAIASSYTWEEGEREHPRDEIYVRTMLDAECQPKTVGDN
jgi:cell cycle arrest protein BUB3